MIARVVTALFGIAVTIIGIHFFFTGLPRESIVALGVAWLISEQFVVGKNGQNN